MINNELAEEAIRGELWARGDLSDEMFPNSQLVLREHIEGWRRANPEDAGPLVVNCHRGMGKSWFLTLYGFEYALRRPGMVVRFGSPTLTQTEEIALPIIQKILSTKPKAISVRKVANNFYFKSPRWGKDAPESVFNLFSCKEDAESMRGKRANLILLDEVRSIDNARYVIEEVLLFLTAMQEDPLMILSSTPPHRPDHAFTAHFIEDARKFGRYFKLSIDENPDFPESQARMLERICGGRHTPGWKREALCITLPDPSLLAVSEFQDAKHEIVREVPRPTHYYIHESMDAGFMDYTAVLFAWVWFIHQKLVIEDELLFHFKSTVDIAEAIQEKEASLWSRAIHREEIARYGDATKQQLHDLRATYGLRFHAADRWDLDASLADLKSAIQLRHIIIHPRCVNLLNQLENSTLNRKRNDFDRPVEKDFMGEDPTRPVMGHSDALMALVYLWKQAKRRMLDNPYPDPKEIWRNESSTIVDLPETQYFDKFGRQVNRKTSRKNITFRPARITRKAMTIWKGPVAGTRNARVPIRKVIGPDGRSTWIKA